MSLSQVQELKSGVVRDSAGGDEVCQEASTLLPVDPLSS